jgi:hypothetical protein
MIEDDILVRREVQAGHGSNDYISDLWQDNVYTKLAIVIGS